MGTHSGGDARDAGGKDEVVGCLVVLTTSCRASPQNLETVDGLPHAIVLALQAPTFETVRQTKERGGADDRNAFGRRQRGFRDQCV